MAVSPVGKSPDDTILIEALGFPGDQQFHVADHQDLKSVDRPLAHRRLSERIRS